MAKNGFWLVGAWVLAIFLAILATTPPAPGSQSDDPREPSSQRAFDHIRHIAARPHPTSSMANARVRQYLVEQLTAMGLEVHTQEGMLGKAPRERLAYMRGDKPRPVARFVNIIGIIKGSDPQARALALMAHYDSVVGSPGAADDGAGIASLLESARALKAGGQPKRDVFIIMTDGEELGLVGARHFFAENPLAGRIGAIVNLETRGGGGIASMFQTAPGNMEAMRLYARAVSHPATSSLSAYLYSILPNDTDLTPALKHGGFSAYNIAFIGRPRLYHSPLATPQNLDLGALNQMLGQTHELATALADAPTLPRASENAVFFDLFGLMTVVYPLWLGWVMLAIAALCLAAAFYRARGAGERGMDWSGLGRGAARMVGLIVLAGGALYLFNWVSGAGVGAGYYDRLAAIPMLTGVATLVSLACVLLIWGRGAGGAAMRIGAALPLVLVAIAGQAYAPSAAYFVVLAVLLAALAEAGFAFAPQWAARLIAALFAALMTGYLLALSWLIMQGVGPTLPYAIALPLALATLGWLSLWPGFKRAQAPRALAALMLLGALALALWVRFDAVPPSVAVYSPLKPG